MPKPVRKNVGVLDVVDWGADYFGVVDSATDIQDLINRAPDGSRIEFEEGTYLIGAPLSWADKTLHFYARGEVCLQQNYAPVMQPMLLGTNAPCTEVVGLDFKGIDTPAWYVANYSLFFGGVSQDAAGLQLRQSEDVFVSRCKAKDKYTGFAFVACDQAHYDSLVIDGFGLEIKQAGGTPNLHMGVAIVQGRDIEGHSSTATNTGNGFLLGSTVAGIGSINPQNVKLFGHTVYDAYDNGIYVSSGREVDIVSAHMEGINSSAFRLQGDDLSVIGGYVNDAGAGVGITALSTAPVYNGIHASRNISITGLTLDNSRLGGIIIDDKSNSQVYTDDVKISDCTIRGTLTDGIYGTADNVSITNTHISDTTRHAIHLLGRGNIPNPKNQLIDNVSTIRTGGQSLRMDGVKDSSVTNFRDCDGNATFVDLNGVANSDFVTLRSTSGRLVEDAASSGNLIANVRGNAANVASGSAHAAWQVEP